MWNRGYRYQSEIQQISSSLNLFVWVEYYFHLVSGHKKILADGLVTTVHTIYFAHPVRNSQKVFATKQSK